MSKRDIEDNQNNAQDAGVEAVGLATRETELMADLQRTRADFENYRKQTDLQRSQYATVVKNTTVTKILPLLDDIDRAVAVYPAELGALAKNLEKTMGELGLAKIDSSTGAEFNHNLHEAVAVEGEGEMELVVETLRNGYLYDDTVLRPAMVKVAKS